MKSGKQINLKSFNKNFKIRAGAVKNYKSPNSVYVNITSWITVKEKVGNLPDLIKQYRLALRKYLKESEVVSRYFDCNTIIQLDISPTGIKGDKPTFFTLELNLYQKTNKNFLPLVKPKNSDIDELKPILEKLSNDLLKLDFLSDNGYFNFNLTKKVKDGEIV